MLNSRRGVSVLVGAILMLAVGVVAASVLVSSISTPALPQSDIPQILENIKVVEVKATTGGTLVYLMNTGTTEVKVSSLYIEDPYSYMKRAIEIPERLMEPGELYTVFLPDYQLDPGKPVSIRVVTGEGKDSTLIHMEPGENSFIAWNLLGTGYISLPTQRNNQPIEYKDIIALLDEDGEVDSLESKSESSSSTPVSGSIKLNNDDVISVYNLIKIGDKYHWDDRSEIKYAHLTYEKKLPPSIAEINIKLKITIKDANNDKKPYKVELKLYNFSSSQYVESPPGYDSKVITKQEGELQLKVDSKDISHFIDAGGKIRFNLSITRLHDIPSQAPTFDDSTVNLQVEYKQNLNSFDSSYVFTIPADVDHSKISRIFFSMVYSFSETLTVSNKWNGFIFTILDKNGNDWYKEQIVRDYTANEKVTLTVTPDRLFDPNYFRDASGQPCYIKVNLHSDPAEVPPYEMSIDVFRMVVSLFPPP